MNSISFTPNVAAYAGMNNKVQNRPAFTGAPKKPTAAQVKTTTNFARRLYKLFYLPSKEAITEARDGNIFTERVEGRIRTLKKYPMFSKKPSEVKTDDAVTKIRKHQIFKQDGSYDLEVSDMHTPGYRVSVEYKGLNDADKRDYSGSITLRYGEKEVTLNDEERKAVLSELSEKSIKLYDEEQKKLFKDSAFARDFIDRYFQDPNVIGSAILSSPVNLNRQLNTVHSSMPYGIERILEVSGK